MNAGAIDERIGELVAAHRPELEQLVDQALERELAQLVSERIAARNGVHVVDTKLCAVCGERPAAKYRTLCGRCRHRERQRRKTEAEPEAEPPHPGGRDHGG